MSAPPPAAWAWVAAGGALGAVTRFAVGGLAVRWFGDEFAWGTLAVNLAGCFAIGLTLHGIAAGALPAQARYAIAIGLLGGLTTFSSFGWETWAYLQREAVGLALANAAANLLGGLGATAVGVMLGRQLWPLTA